MQFPKHKYSYTVISVSLRMANDRAERWRVRYAEANKTIAELEKRIEELEDE